jgi:hypothetical protein
MKIQITITKEEHDKTANAVWVDPCTHINCGHIDCETCPLRERVRELRKEQEKFMEVLDAIEVEKND